MLNPFKPTAGAMPPELIGRAELLREFEYGLKNGPGSPGLLTVITGARGIGKTVLLGAAEDAAMNHGWLVISETATPGFSARIGEGMRLGFEERGPGPAGRKITGISVAGLGVRTQLPPEDQVSWRRRAELLLDELAGSGGGLAITVDEIHAAERAELTQLAADVQHLIRQNRPIALVFAGLPASVSDLLNDDVATFLRRADRIDLGLLSTEHVADSYRAIFTELQDGHTLNQEFAHAAAQATGGYPYLVQLIGYHLWRIAEESPEGAVEPRLDAAGLRQGIRDAKAKYVRTVIQAALASTTERDRSYLRSMAKDLGSADGVTSAEALRARLGLNSAAVAQTRARLIDAGLIESAGYGNVRYVLPGLGEYLSGYSS